jgi:hypothetical protein
VFKELAHLICRQRLSKAVSDYIISRSVDNPNLLALYFLSQLIVIDIDVSELSCQLEGILVN